MEEDYLDADRLSQGGDTNPTLLDSATQFKDYLREGGHWGYSQDLGILQHYFKRHHMTNMNC